MTTTATLRPRPADLGPVAEPMILAFSIPAAIVVGLTVGFPAAAGVLAIMWPPALASWTYAAVRRCNLRVEFDDHCLVHVNVWRRRTVIPRTEIRAAHVLSFDGPAGVPAWVVVVMGRDGAVALSLWEPRWDIDRTTKFFGGLVRIFGRPLGATLDTVRATIPGLPVPFPVAHPFLAMLAGWAAFTGYAAVVLGIVVAVAT
ncbi:hypothetical protein ACQEVC_20615 [Plantactinospora sp. CA-294935]|uniref:hypothetical protein n=1 Tax=Plantactinospora sp. CA-294935 TaxID=3240012 RepID=UPI003D8A0F79